MVHDHLICDGEEIIAKVIGVQAVRTGGWSMQTLPTGQRPGVRQLSVTSTWVTKNIHHDKIRSIRVESTKRRVLWLFSVGDEQIVIELKSGEKVAIPRHREATFFDSYIERLRDFCGRYGIAFAAKE